MAIFHCLGDSRLPADSAACRIEGPAQTGSAALLPGARSRAGATAPPCLAPAPGRGQIRAQGGTDRSWHTKRVLTSASSHRHLSLFLVELGSCSGRYRDPAVPGQGSLLAPPLLYPQLLPTDPIPSSSHRSFPGSWLPAGHHGRGIVVSPSPPQTPARPPGSRSAELVVSHLVRLIPNQRQGKHAYYNYPCKKKSTTAEQLSNMQLQPSIDFTM